MWPWNRGKRSILNPPASTPRPESDQEDDTPPPPNYMDPRVDGNMPMGTDFRSWKQRAMGLWQILDDIDTLSDMMHPKQTPYYEAVMKRAGKRGDYLHSDGYQLYVPGAMPHSPKVGERYVVGGGSTNPLEKMPNLLDGEEYISACPVHRVTFPIGDKCPYCVSEKERRERDIKIIGVTLHPPEDVDTDNQIFPIGPVATCGDCQHFGEYGGNGITDGMGEGYGACTSGGELDGCNTTKTTDACAEFFGKEAGIPGPRKPDDPSTWSLPRYQPVEKLPDGVDPDAVVKAVEVHKAAAMSAEHGIRTACEKVDDHKKKAAKMPEPRGVATIRKGTAPVKDLPEKDDEPELACSVCHEVLDGVGEAVRVIEIIPDAKPGEPQSIKRIYCKEHMPPEEVV